MNTPIRILFAAMLATGLVACKKDAVKPPMEKTPETTNAGTTETGTVDNGKFDPSDLDSNACLMKRVINFDFDQADIRGEYNEILACHAKYLQDRPEARMTLEGHADERGTREYNIGLGERRGNAVNAGLQGNGASASQMTVVSYGEEQPNCNETSESCWAQNRRVEIVYTTK